MCTHMHPCVYMYKRACAHTPIHVYTHTNTLTRIFIAILSTIAQPSSHTQESIIGILINCVISKLWNNTQQLKGMTIWYLNNMNKTQRHYTGETGQNSRCVIEAHLQGISTRNTNLMCRISKQWLSKTVQTDTIIRRDDTEKNDSPELHYWLSSRYSRGKNEVDPSISPVSWKKEWRHTIEVQDYTMTG